MGATFGGEQPKWRSAEETERIEELDLPREALKSPMVFQSWIVVCPRKAVREGAVVVVVVPPSLRCL